MNTSPTFGSNQSLVPLERSPANIGPELPVAPSLHTQFHSAKYDLTESAALACIYEDGHDSGVSTTLNSPQSSSAMDDFNEIPAADFSKFRPTYTTLLIILHIDVSINRVEAERISRQRMASSAMDGFNEIPVANEIPASNFSKFSSNLHGTLN